MEFSTAAVFHVGTWLKFTSALSNHRLHLLTVTQRTNHAHLIYAICKKGLVLVIISSILMIRADNKQELSAVKLVTLLLASVSQA